MVSTDRTRSNRVIPPFGLFPRSVDRQVRTLGSRGSARPAGEVYTISSALLNASRVLAAGAQLVTMPTPRTVASTGSEMRARRPISFGVVMAPSFEIVAEGSQVTPSELPFASAEIELADAPSHALSFNLTRRQHRDSDDEDLEYIVDEARLASSFLHQAIRQRARARHRKSSWVTTW